MNAARRVNLRDIAEASGVSIQTVSRAVRGLADQALTKQLHIAAAHRHQAGDGLDQGGLAGAVGAQHGDDLAARHLQLDATQNVHFGRVAGHQALDRQGEFVAARDVG